MEQLHMPTRRHAIKTRERQPPHKLITLQSQSPQVELRVLSPEVGRLRRKPKNPPAVLNKSGIAQQEPEGLMDEPIEDAGCLLGWGIVLPGLLWQFEKNRIIQLRSGMEKQIVMANISRLPLLLSFYLKTTRPISYPKGVNYPPSTSVGLVWKYWMLWGSWQILVF